jgi:HEPN domain-containing protein
MNVANEWLNQARVELEHAKETLVQENEEKAYIICFHAQQAVEKALKSILIFHEQTLPKIHDLVKLNQHVSTFCVIEETKINLVFLTQGAVDTRYPCDAVTLEQSGIAVDIASNVYNQVQNYLIPLLDKK